jgi:hypothetical protein
VALFDFRNYPTESYNISAQRVLANGQLGSPHIPIIPQSLNRIESVSSSYIKYSLAQGGEVRLELFDLLGRRITELQQSFQQAGLYITRIDTPNLPSGVYLVRLSTPVGSEAARLIITR